MRLPLLILFQTLPSIGQNKYCMNLHENNTFPLELKCIKGDSVLGH